MALIKCSECGKEISNKAKACMYCGCPIEEMEFADNETTGTLFLSNGKSSETSMLPYEKKIVVFTQDDVELCSLLAGESVTLTIKDDIEIYAVRSSVIPIDKCLKNRTKKFYSAQIQRSNTMKVLAKGTTRLQATLAGSGVGVKLVINKVDNIDAE